MAPLGRKLTEIIRREALRYDLDDLVAAKDAALGALSSRSENIAQWVRRKLNLSETDEWPLPDPNDPDDPLHDLYEQAGEMDSQAERGLHIARKTFLIALFHLYERHRKLGVPKTVEPSTRTRAVSLLLDLEAVANCAKHPAGGRGAIEALRRRPDLFPHIAAGKQPSERYLHISDDVLLDFFQAVKLVAQPKMVRGFNV
jgi:hypothetical protein